MTKKPTKDPKRKQPAAVINRRARFDYELGQNILAGMVLTGAKVRAVRDSRVHLKGAFVVIRNDELWLQNASFSVKSSGNDSDNVIDTSPVKLLVNKKELKELTRARTDGYTIVPTKLLPSRRYIKVEIAIGKGKKSYDKRETIKRRESDREALRQMKGQR
ncbi:SsrA-binding protein SmpB [Candidatus Saccharibacteria bacterium]|nr:SsrA-binding protein SmpB [Candidatus Saccharibacteria bacterium]